VSIRQVIGMRIPTYQLVTLSGQPFWSSQGDSRLGTDSTELLTEREGKPRA